MEEESYGKNVVGSFETSAVETLARFVGSVDRAPMIHSVLKQMLY